MKRLLVIFLSILILFCYVATYFIYNSPLIKNYSPHLETQTDHHHHNHDNIDDEHEHRHEHKHKHSNNDTQHDHKHEHDHGYEIEIKIALNFSIFSYELLQIESFSVFAEYSLISDHHPTEIFRPPIA